MGPESSQSHEVDLERTDRLPILEGALFDPDVEDDAVVMDRVLIDPEMDDDGATVERPAPPPAPALPVIVSQTAHSDFSRPPVDLPGLAESVRSVEERIARQNAEYEALSRNYERAKDAEASAIARATALGAELASVQSALAVEQHRAREMERAAAERITAVEAMRARADEALRTAEGVQAETRTLRDSLAARDATIAQVLHSLGERDAQLSALQREHAQIVPVLEARSQTSARLELELKAARKRTDEIALELKNAQASAAAAAQRVKSSATELNTVREDASAAKRQSHAYLEILRTREWRRGFDLNLFREWDAKINAAQTGHGVVQAERDQLRLSVAALSRKLSEQEEAMAKLSRMAAADSAALVKKTDEFELSERARNALTAKLEAVEDERNELKEHLAARDQALLQLREQGSGETQRVKDLLAKAERAHADERALLERAHAEDRASLQKAYTEDRANLERAHAEERARTERSHADERAQAERALVEYRAQVEKTSAEQRALLERAHADERARAERAYGEEHTRLEKTLAEERARFEKTLLEERVRFERTIVEERAHAQRVQEEQSTKLAELEAQAEAHEQELAVLMAHLNEARRPVASIQADVKRLTDELAEKSASNDQLNEDNRNLRATLERTRGALEEREFLIRRLERAESNNANVLGRIQTTIEKLGTQAPLPPVAVSMPECIAEFIRVDQGITYPLGRRTRLGRAAGCELQVDASSVSRNHALLIKTPREVIIEDLNSTNGVVVNGRKISRQVLSDGDLVMIGDVQFRCAIRSAPHPAHEVHPLSTTPG